MFFIHYVIKRSCPILIAGQLLFYIEIKIPYVEKDILFTLD